MKANLKVCDGFRGHIVADEVGDGGDQPDETDEHAQTEEASEHPDEAERRHRQTPPGIDSKIL